MNNEVLFSERGKQKLKFNGYYYVFIENPEIKGIGDVRSTMFATHDYKLRLTIIQSLMKQAHTHMSSHQKKNYWFSQS